MSDTFLNRADEIRALERAWRNPGAHLVLVWGRRRTGKTRLLGRFVDGKRAVFYGATEQSSEAELRAPDSLGRGYFLGDYFGLVAAGGDVVAAFTAVPPGEEVGVSNVYTLRLTP